MALEHAREAVAHFSCRLADRDRPRHVGRSVEILGAGIEEIEGAKLEALLGLRHRPIVDDRAVRTGARYRREAQTPEMLVLASASGRPIRLSSAATPPNQLLSPITPSSLAVIECMQH
jgi:hypothetical protein